MAARRRASGEGHPRSARRGYRIFLLDEAGQRLSLVAGDRQPHQHTVVAGHKVALPCAPHQGIPLPEEKTVSGMVQRSRVVAAGRVVEELQRPHVAAVAEVVEQPVVAARRVDRL